jgi:hypothetical protein
LVVDVEGTAVVSASLSGFDSFARPTGLNGSVVGLPMTQARLEPVKGIEPSSAGWKPAALPLSYTGVAWLSERPRPLGECG